MGCEIIWMPNAIISYNKNIDYLQEKWTEKEVITFTALTKNKIQNLIHHPKIGTARNKKYPNIRFTLIHKRVALIYRYKPLKNEIELLVFWNTWQNPRKLKVK